MSISKFDWNRDYYGYVYIGGYGCYYGRFRAWKLYNLTSDAVKTLGQHPDEVKALFETEAELKAYIESLRDEPMQNKEEAKLKTIGSEGGDKLIISSIL